MEDKREEKSNIAAKLKQMDFSNKIRLYRLPSLIQMKLIRSNKEKTCLGQVFLSDNV